MIERPMGEGLKPIHGSLSYGPSKQVQKRCRY
ncbi:unnamed protein product [Hydatigera taeniaeformis]|uniref:Uncharacterized protein n=1 Tax=Hydatigena taeniaeformis TaxID=6205 RepID=A0A3P7FSH6_HYDTA|nr:unnamed protein product [Hydatigera taeniaeformis]